MTTLSVKSTLSARVFLAAAVVVFAFSSIDAALAESETKLNADSGIAIDADKTPETPGLPAMWKMSDADTTVTLFGTMHALPPGIDWQSQLYQDEMRSATTTITETDTDSAEALQSINELVLELGFNPPGTTLSDVLGTQRADQLIALAKPYGLTADVLQPMRPWLAGVSISTAAMTAAGHDFALGVDKEVEETARKENDEIVYLENARLQLEALASTDEIDSEVGYDAMLEQFETINETSNALLKAWTIGNLAELEKHIVKDLQEISPAGYQKLIVQRNLNWLKELSRIMEEEQGHFFVAVGAGHFVGDDSIIRYLRELGFQVERIQ